jgi:hypothetical protein
MLLLVVFMVAGLVIRRLVAGRLSGFAVFWLHAARLRLAMAVVSSR